jgi:hypothetical protein
VSYKYWKYVEPVWNEISIYDGGDKFLQQFSLVTEKQKTLFASHWAHSEIMNGGLGQFYSNPTGVLAPEAAAAFDRIRMPKSAKILRESMKFFGSPYPRSNSIRSLRFEEFFDKFGQDTIPLLELEDEMALVIESENDGFWASADRFAEDSD